MSLQQIQQFIQYFGEEPALLVRSPGRVNLIGEHTDYNEGWVLPAALTMGTVVTARRRPDRILHTVARLVGGEDQVALDDLMPGEGPQWTRYVRGITAMLCEMGCSIPGADLLIDGDLPLGSGLSSSASMEMAVAVALTELADCKIDPKEMAKLGQRAENEIVGVQSGIMDQLAAVFGVASHALLIDCRTLDIDLVPISPDIRVLILDSAMPRELVGTALNRRRAECNSAVRKLQEVQPNIKALRDVTSEILEQEGWRLDANELRRARHVVTENGRVHSSVMSLSRGNIAEVGRLMVASHQSLRDDYEVSLPELDTLVTIATNDIKGVYGARLTGAGFGGCALALVEASEAEAASAQIINRYREATGREGRAYICIPGDGVRAYKIATLH